MRWRNAHKILFAFSESKDDVKLNFVRKGVGVLTEFRWFRIEVSEHGSHLYSWASSTLKMEGTSSETLLAFISRHGYISQKTRMLNSVVFKMCGISLPVERLSVSHERACSVKLVCP